MRLDLHTLALYFDGATPDLNTQSEEEVAATMDSIEQIVSRWNGSVPR